MQTPSIDFTGTDKVSVFAGVRKLSDAAIGTIFCLGTAGAVAGFFQLFAPRLTGAGGNYGARGFTSGNEPVDVNSGAFLAPTTNVVSAMFDEAGSSGSKIVLRVNGGQVAGGTDVVVGANQPITIGLRSTDLPFNGHIHSLIVRGAQTDTPTIERTEKYVASKTAGVSIP
jgi:hypothetical protein